MTLCRFCSQLIHETGDDVAPWVHDHSGNLYCDVTTPESAVLSAWANPLGLRDVAEPV